MLYKSIYIALIAFVFFINLAETKKSKRIQRPKIHAEETTPQPNVVTYSTFGFNDVGSFNGFIPSSPDYVNYLNGVNQQDSSTRLYAPAFPTALDSSGFSNTYTSQDGQSFDVEVPSSGSAQHQPIPINIFNNLSYDSVASQSQNYAVEEPFGEHTSEYNAPVYGTKLSSKNKSKPVNSSDFSIYSNGISNINDNKYSSYYELQSQHENKPTSNSESNNNNFQNFNSYIPTVNISEPSLQNIDQTAIKNSNVIKFPKIIDFTKMKQYYPLEVEEKFSETTTTPAADNLIRNENLYKTYYDNHQIKSAHPTLESTFDFKHSADDKYKVISKPNKYHNQEFSNAYLRHLAHTNNIKNNHNNNSKKTWISTNDYHKPSKGFQYSTDHSNITIKYNSDEIKKPSDINKEEIVPSSSNLIDTSYKFPEEYYGSFKKIPTIKPHYDEDYNNIQTFNYQNKYKSDDYIKQFRNLYSTVPTTTSLLKSPEFSSYKNHLRKPVYDDFNDEVVHIPKKLYGKQSHAQYFENNPNDWLLHTKQRPYKIKQYSDLKSVNRYKSEEDLLGLRNHDTTRPSHFPVYKPRESLVRENDYNKLVDKWRQSYWKAKYQNLISLDSDDDDGPEIYTSESKPVHVPVPKPYPIEVPHPVIVPIPQPYPVRVPVPKPVAVPVVKELTIPIEKPVPYPVIKKVPYAVEKPVPIRVEKQVAVPIMKPYPVPVPQIRTVFHHTKPHDDIDSEIDMEEDDYLPHSENSDIRSRKPYQRRPPSTHRSRRPTRAYHDRNRRRWPERKPMGNAQNSYRRPIKSQHFSAQKYYGINMDEDDHNPEDYSSYCRRTGKC